MTALPTGAAADRTDEARGAVPWDDGAALSTVENGEAIASELPPGQKRRQARESARTAQAAWVTYRSYATASSASAASHVIWRRPVVGISSWKPSNQLGAVGESVTPRLSDGRFATVEVLTAAETRILALAQRGRGQG